MVKKSDDKPEGGDPQKGKVVEEVSKRVMNTLIESVEKITPWFFRALPAFYYQMTSIEEQIEHLHTIISLMQTNAPTTTLRSADGYKVTFISVTNRPNQLVDCLRQLTDHNIRSAAVHTALEGDLVVNNFYFKTNKIDPGDEESRQKIEEIRKQFVHLSPAEMDKVDAFLDGMERGYLTRYDTRRMARHIEFYRQIKDYETVFNLDNAREEQFSRISLCTLNPPATGYLFHIAKILAMHGVQINRLYINSIESKKSGEIVLLTIYAMDKNGNQILEDSVLWTRLKAAIKTVKWVVDDEISSLIGWGEKLFSVRKANFIRAASVFVHQFLSKAQVDRYTYEVIKKAFLRYPQITDLLVEYFYARFSPFIEDACPHCGTAIEKRKRDQKAIREQLDAAFKEVQPHINKEIFDATLRFIDHILKTNYFLEDSVGLAFRMDPQVLDVNFYQPRPFGFFFFFGRGYKGFHIRFKDMARGGLRIVPCRDKEHYDYESTRVFDEVFGLSSAQQMKNKDIPEGGAKGILLLQPGFDIRASVEAAIDSLLDLIVADEPSRTHPKAVDYYGQEELIYLGPDENITDELILWIVKRAKERKYKYPNAFMSSKPGVGINHKEFGVTSQGLNVYLETCLRYLKIDPYRDEFTVRMAGGPDGDVAGNELKILIHNHPRVKILAISDGGGVGYDAQGLDHQELLRLVKESKTIAEFNRSLLHKGAENFVLEVRTAEGRKMRDEMQVSNLVKSDIFIPAGGRPNTINAENWRRSLDSEGKPVFKAIVEGANIFLTKEARLCLEEKGAIIIKDSSANKCGVICSSYEILSSLLLSEEEFLSIRPQYILEVIEILKNKARLEAELLFREYALRKTSLALLSAQISEEINGLKDTIRSFIDDELHGADKERYLNLLKAHCPKILVEKYGERIVNNLPLEHRLAIVATQIATYLVYHEGLGWIKSLNYPDLEKVVRVYLEQDLMVTDYIKKILASNLPGKEFIARIVEHNARKELTQEALLGR